MADSDTSTGSRRAIWWLLVSAIGLLASLFLLAVLQGHRQQESRGIGPAFPGPIRGASVSPLCVNVALERYSPSGAAASGDNVTQVLTHISEGGFAWLRQTFPWAEIEVAPDQYDWGQWDGLVQAVAEHPGDLQLVAVLDTAPEWAVGNSGEEWDAVPPAIPADMARFAAALAERYGEVIDVYQVWDEPNLNSHWGGRDVSPAEYAALLSAVSTAIREADADGDATIVLGGLAPTTETGPRNLSDVRFLEALYDLGAAPDFDVVSGKPYGFDTPASDRRLNEQTLNFSRLILLREVMLENGDADKGVWASHWGWNALPPGWAGAPSVWGQTDPDTQAKRTVEGLDRAWREWPWAGALCLENWQPDAAVDDARWGFAVISQDGTPRPILSAISEWADANGERDNAPGYHRAAAGRSALEPAGKAGFEGEWRFSELGADATDAGGQSVTIPFEGTDLGLRVRRGDYRAHFYVSVDGLPANALPQDDTGAYLVLTSPDGVPQEVTLPAARDLDEGAHVAELRAVRGWGQWPLVGWSVGWRRGVADTTDRFVTLSLGLLAMVCVVGILWSVRRIRWRWASLMLAATWRGLGSAAQIAVAAGVTLTFWASAWLTWGQEHAAGAGGLIATAATATLFYVSPVFIVSLISLVLLALLIILRLDLGLALVAFAAPFYLQSRAMYVRAFSVVEIAVLLCLVSWTLHQLPRIRDRLRRQTTSAVRQDLAPRYFSQRIRFMDYAVLFFVAVSVASLMVAELRGVALHEFRVVVLEPALFYLMLRTTVLNRKATWRIVDAFVLGAAIVALFGLYQYAFTDQIITAEGGMRRLKSVYGSPNNVGLYLGRAFPVLLAVLLFAGKSARRWFYGAGAVFVGLAILLSFSKGALLFGVPASVLALGLLAGGRWLWASLVTLVVAAVAAIPMLRTPRFTSLFDLQSGTSFFRLNLWRSTVDMIRDHPVLGVGLDNFLYTYRGRYIRPTAWQEPDLSHPHNVVLDYWSRLGIFGLAAGVWLQAAFWRLAFPLRRLDSRDDRALALGLMASMIDFLAHGLVDNSYFLVDLAFAFFLTLGLVVHLARFEVPYVGSGAETSRHKST